MKPKEKLFLKKMSHHKTLLRDLKRNYFKAPNAIFGLSLSTSAIAVYCFLASGADDFDPPISSIAKRLDLDRKTVAKAFRELEVRGLIATKKERADGNKTRVRWWFLDPLVWTPKANKTEVRLAPTGEENGPAPDQKAALGQTKNWSLTRTTTKRKQSPSVSFSPSSSSKPAPSLRNENSRPSWTQAPSTGSSPEETIEKLRKMAAVKHSDPRPSPGSLVRDKSVHDLSQDQLEALKREYAYQGRDPDEAGFEDWRVGGLGKKR